MNGQWRALPALLSCSLLSCGAGPDLPALLFETEHFRYHARPDVEVCEGLGRWLEHHYETVGEALGARLPAKEKIDIYVFTDRDDLIRNACPPDTFGCARGRTVYQFVPFMPHEFIHAYASLVGKPPVLFDEALAHVLGCGPGANSEEIERSPALVHSALTTESLRRLGAENRREAQDAANGFVRFLIDQHGLERFMVFYAAIARDESKGGIEREVSNAFGVDLDTLLARWEVGPPQTKSSLCLHLAECAADPLATAGETELVPACVYAGSPAGFLPHAAIRRLTLDAKSGVVLRAASSGMVSIRGCSAPLHPTRSDWLSPEPGQLQELWTDLEAGDYWVLAGGEATDGNFSAEVGPPLFADRCSESTARPISASTAAVHIFGSSSGFMDDDPPDGVPDVAVGLEVAEDRLARIFRFEGQAWLCAGGCPADRPACNSTSVSTELTVGSRNTLVLQGDDGFAVRLNFEF